MPLRSCPQQALLGTKSCLTLSPEVEIRVDSRLHRGPQPENLGIPKRENLGCNHTPNTSSTTGPPEQIRQASPPGRATAVDGAVSEVQEERQTPALRNLMRLRVQFGQVVRILGFRWHDRLSRKVGELGDLVGEHGVHRLLAKQSRAGRGVDAVVQQHADDLSVLI